MIDAVKKWNRPYKEYGNEIVKFLKLGNIRAELADCEETLGKRIRQAQVEKIKKEIAEKR